MRGEQGRLWAAVGAIGLLVAGCSTSPYVSTTASGNSTLPKLRQDREALAIMAEVAPKALKLEGGKVTSTDCWTPSQHLFTDPAVAPPGTWKVLCRVHYDLNGVARYQDANCIGDFNSHPMLDHCYVWKFHFGTARFEDGDALASAPPTPLPAP